MLAVLLIAIAIFNFKISFSKKGMFEKMRDFTDECDRYLTMKTSYLLIGFMNYALAGFIFVFSVAYGVWKSFYFSLHFYKEKEYSN